MKRLKFYLPAMLFISQSMVYAAQQPPLATSASSVTENSQLINGSLLVENARANSTIPGVRISAGYLKLTNNSKQTIRFSAAKTPAAQHTEFHSMVLHDSKMAMRKIKTIEIKAQHSVEFKENHLHLMFIGLNRHFKAGESITLTLIEDNGQNFKLVMPIIDQKSY
ncbi:MAG: copper chaperone PCu(A)C [Psychromonas sp.]|nr:copper chaperone PCu(A)C [Psychromonas sp.]